MKNIVILLLLFCVGCADRPWKPLKPPVYVVWSGGHGELRVAHDERFAILSTNFELDVEKIFSYKEKILSVHHSTTTRQFKFCYFLEIK
jgi:hypothetical protein